MLANRTRVVRAAVLMSAVITAQAALADGLIRKLPDDGTWATFKTEGYKEKRDKRKETSTGWLRISSVGRVTEDGQPCRWLEVDSTYSNGGRPERRSIDKLLLPEKYLAAGEAPGEHVLRGWTRFDQPEQGQVRKLGLIDGKSYPGQSAFVLVGPASDERRLEPIEVDHKKLGRITCERVTGTFRFKAPAAPEARDVSGTFEARLHEGAPFGVVWYEIVTPSPDGRELKMTLSLDDLGPTAVSALPDQN